ncbi:hypothetical protein A3D62_00820 [Candidatus Kaiserbacteria bacterium RIFCSPHIGHO2_02_FULL_49_11]|uniref:DNA methylase N-4/N-6 domain-containing protein n=1 Tax=Candidatus Kaiserbacteria bacterium RIFCSPHIGHO2_02_FULL_49_11 TaxID=1798489 RepID=A0A1F6D1G1_9BACT|nr:MAG: hypothetical protein A3D62_00820 [Candidatus Kaiserbacteria bacterium RIFCSPHIGHO2_02_FULL_49_11]
MKNHKKVNLTSSDLSAEKLAELRRVLPEAFGEDKIDWDKLRAVLGDKIDERIEKFNFSWAGKTGAIQNVLTPSKATLRPEKSEGVKFDTSENLFIDGDNLEVLKLLQKAYFEQVKMIYIDPPYNTGGDFVYRDDFSAPLKSYLQQTGQVDAEGNKLQTNRETSGRYHSDWLSMMYPRLKLAWNLLRDDGVIFVSIDDNEIHRLRMMMDEIFSEEHFVGQLIVRSNPRGSQEPYGVSAEHEYILVYSKTDAGKMIIIGAARDEDDAEFNYITEEEKQARLLGLRKRGGDWRRVDRPNMFYPFYVNPDTYKVSTKKEKGFTVEVLPVRPDGEESRWTWGKDTAKERITELIGKKIQRNGLEQYDIYRIDLLQDEEGNTKREKLKSILEDKAFNYQSARQYFKLMFGTSELFDFPKPPELIQKLMSSIQGDDYIVLDFFAGSGTTAQSVLEQNLKDAGSRKFVLVQLPEQTPVGSIARQKGYENIADISKDRIRKVLEGYGDEPKPIDDGFKVFKLGVSNYAENQFEFDPAKSEDENKKAFEIYIGKTKQAALFGDADELAVVYENIIKEGLSLNSKITEQKIGKNSVYFVDGDKQQLLVCLDKKIDDKTVSELTGGSYKGKTFICLDNALDDTSKANLGLNVELKTI